MHVISILKNSLIASLLLTTFTGIVTIPHFYSTVLGSTNDLTVSTIVSLTNLARTESGLKTLTPHPVLNDAAQKKASHMVDQNYFSHKLGGSNPAWDLITQEGYLYGQAGENLARGFTHSEILIEAWLSSSPHQANLLSSDYQDTGVGIAYSETSRKFIIVQLFASPLLPGQLDQHTKTIDTPLLVPKQTLVSRIIIFISIFIASTVSVILAIKPAKKRVKKKRPLGKHLWRS